jgi:DNA-binding HxlR family transcriptional regulator
VTVRFEQLQADLGISRKVLTERLNHLVDQGVLERRPDDRRPRHEYVLTEKGTELVDLLMVMVAWGDGWLAHCGEPMHANDIDVLPGPGAAA